MGAVTDRASRADVIHAACDLILNAVRQQHPALRDAQQELAGITQWLMADLPSHYDTAGRRRETRIVLPPLREIAAQIR
jgi:hypothetical protein